MKTPPLKSKKCMSDVTPLIGQTVLHGLESPSVDNIFKVIDDQYENDPLGPTTMSAEEAPPVKRAYAVYGINVPTDVGYDIVQKEGRVKTKFVLDKYAKIDTESADSCSGYNISGGRIYETCDIDRITLVIALTTTIRYKHTSLPNIHHIQNISELVFSVLRNIYSYCNQNQFYKCYRT